MKIPFSARPSSGKRGFTLIELLVVISIIAVLAGLLFPAMGAVRTTARKASAKNDCLQIVNAVKNFYTDYGKYPVANGFTSTGSDNSAVIKELRAPASETLTHNTRKVRYLEVKEPKTGVADADVRGAVDSTSNWKDPWYSAYVIFIDGNYDGAISITGLATSYNGARQIGVAAASHGPRDKGVTTAGASPVVSWE